ncbi:unnamed protein product [Gordionus sp. m RMFG-2023]
MQDNKDLRLILTPLQIPSTDISITTTTFPMAPLPCIFRHIFDDHHSPILDIGNMTEICAFCNNEHYLHPFVRPLNMPFYL